MEELKLNTIEEAIADFREGKFVNSGRRRSGNEGDLIVVAEKNYSRTSQFHVETCTVTCFVHLLPFSLQRIGITSSSRIKHVSL